MQREASKQECHVSTRLSVQHPCFVLAMPVSNTRCSFIAQDRRRQSHYEAMASVGDGPSNGAWQQPAYQAASSRNKNLPTSRGSATDADIHPSSNPGKPAPRTGAHQQPSSRWSLPRVDSLASDGVMAARRSGEDQAGLSNRHRSEQQEHQHKPHRPSAELESSSGVNSGTVDANNVQAARPYATEQSLKVGGQPHRRA